MKPLKFCYLAISGGKANKIALLLNNKTSVFETSFKRSAFQLIKPKCKLNRSMTLFCRDLWWNYDDDSSVDSTKIENLHLIRCELISPSQDCFSVLYTTWEWIRRANVCVGVCVTVCIISNNNVGSSTKCGPIAWTPVNSIYLPSNQALEWCQSFVISEWKYERLGSTCPETTRLWRIRCEINILYIEF